MPYSVSGFLAFFEFEHVGHGKVSLLINNLEDYRDAALS